MLKPLAILFNGLTVYQPLLTPLTPFASDLEAAGYETCITNHFNTGCNDLREPALIVGHSQGGSTALRFAYQYPKAQVITFDAVRMPPCPTRSCINFKTLGYPDVKGAMNVVTRDATHITLPLQRRVREEAITVAGIAADIDPAKLARTPIHRGGKKPTWKAPGSVGKALLRHHQQHGRSTDGVLDGKDDIWPGADRWPNDEFGDLMLTLEQWRELCARGCQ